MGITKFKPTTPSLRERAVVNSSELTKNAEKLKSSFAPLKSKAGRNNAGRITTRHKGCLLYTSPSPRDVEESRMPSSA